MNLEHEPESTQTKYHRPDEQLTNYVMQKSLLPRQIKELEKRGKKLDLTNQEKEKINEEIKKLREEKLAPATVKNMKTKVLDLVLFPSMANLTYFFDAVSKYPELENFNSDIAELLGIRREHPRPENYALNFVKLIDGMISTTGEYEKNDFRISLIHELQKIISYKFQDLSTRTFPPVDVFGGSSPFKVVNDDMSRTLAWTQMIASKIADQYNFEEVTAPEKIPAQYLQDDETKRKYSDKRTRKRWEEFDSEQQKPKRSITFS
jgi:hypothetical protein